VPGRLGGSEATGPHGLGSPKSRRKGHWRKISSMYAYIYIYMYIYTVNMIIEGSLEVKLPTIWTDEKQSRAEAERRERSEERRVEEKE